MASSARSRVWTMRLTYGLLALGIVFVHLLPLSTLPARWAPPDLLIAITFAWALRRPDYVPPLLVALVMLAADLLLQRPPGLMAFLVVAGTEYLKYRFTGLRDASFAGEWAAVCVVICAVTLSGRVILVLTAVDRAPLMLTLIQMILTALVYPLVVAISQGLFGIRKLAPGDADAIGGRA